MATPLKPWERSKRSLASSGSSQCLKESDSVTSDLQSSRFGGTGPIVPPRPASSSSPLNASGLYTPYAPYSYPLSRYSAYQPYGSSYTQYGGGFGLYGGSGYSQYGLPPGQQVPSVVRRAEERSRIAFQSVESVVGAVSSVSMMLESTYVAVQSCFRALLGVAHHFDTLRQHLWSMVASILLLRKLWYFLLWLLYKLRLRQASGEHDMAWDTVRSSITRPQPTTTVWWPVLTFFTVVFGVPWLLWHLVAKAATQGDDGPESQQRSWTNQGEGQLRARALFGYQATRSDELSFGAGDEMVVAPQQLQVQVPAGWILAGRNKQSGLVPANYVEILPAKPASNEEAPPGERKPPMGQSARDETDFSD